MKVLQATLGFLPAVAWGGPVKIVHQNALELNRRGHDVSICASNLFDKRRTIRPDTFDDFIDDLPVTYLETHVLPQWPGTLGPSWLSAKAGRRLGEIVAAADIMHVNGTRNAISMGTMRRAAHHGKPLVLQTHGTLPHIIGATRVKSLYDRLILRRMFVHVGAFIAGQPAEVAQIVAAGGDPERIHVVPNGLDDSDYDGRRYAGNFRERFAVPEDRRIILFLARINRKKGADLLVEAFARLSRDERAGLQLVIAGPDDGQLAEVQSLIARYSLEESVLLPGLLTGDDVLAAYEDADLFVLPCRVDTFPMALIEACRAGTPIVVTETCEIADHLRDRAAEIVPVDVDALARAMAEVLSSPGRQQALRQGAAELMRTVFSISAVGAQLEAIYQELLEPARTAA